jgi:preprotein translocase subunit SecE
MNAKTEVEGSSGLDVAKLIAAVAILGAGIAGFYYFADQQALWIRLLGLLVVVGVGAFVALQTTAGRGFWRFAVDARGEVRKVVWPSRQETLQTSLIIFVAVLIMAIFLWAIDSLLFLAVRYLTGQGG